MEFNKIAESTGLIKYSFIFVLMCLIIFLSYFFFIKADFLQYRLFVEEEKQLKAEFAKKLPEANIEAYQNQLEILKNQADNLLGKLPKKQDMAAVLAEISTLGLANGVTFDLFAPGEQINHDFYYELPLTVKALGTYQQLAKFISKIANLKYPIAIHHFVINKAPLIMSNGHRNNFLMIKIKLNIINHD